MTRQVTVAERSGVVGAESPSLPASCLASELLQWLRAIAERDNDRRSCVIRDSSYNDACAQVCQIREHLHRLFDWRTDGLIN